MEVHRAQMLSIINEKMYGAGNSDMELYQPTTFDHINIKYI